MKIPKAALQELKELLREDFPEDQFSDEEILNAAVNLLTAVHHTYKEIPEKNVMEFLRLKSER